LFNEKMNNVNTNMNDVTNENEKTRFDGLVSDFFDLSREHEGPIRTATWNCTSGFTTQFEYFRDFMKTRAEPYIDILCLQGFPAGNARKHPRVFELFEECGFSYVYSKDADDSMHIHKTMTLFKRSFLEKYDVIPCSGHEQSMLEIYHIKLKGIDSESINDNFVLTNVYFNHGVNKSKILLDIDEYCYEELGNPYKIVIGDFNYDAHKDFPIQTLLSVRSMTPDTPTCNGYRADHILSDIHIMSMVDERFTRGKYNGYIKIAGNHFHQPVYGFFVPRREYSIYQCQNFYDTQRAFGCDYHNIDRKSEIPTM